MTIYIRVYSFLHEISGEHHCVEALDGVSLNLSASSAGEGIYWWAQIVQTATPAIGRMALWKSRQ